MDFMDSGETLAVMPDTGSAKPPEVFRSVEYGGECRVVLSDELSSGSRRIRDDLPIVVDGSVRVSSE